MSLRGARQGDVAIPQLFRGKKVKFLPFGFDEDSEACKALKKAIINTVTDLIQQKGVTHFITDMATYAAEILTGLKAWYPGIVLECAIPHEAQAAKWGEPQRDRYFALLSKCDVETLLQRRYTGDCFQKCRRYLMDQADYVIVVRGKAPDGMGKAVCLARDQSKLAAVLEASHLGDDLKSLRGPAAFAAGPLFGKEYQIWKYRLALLKEMS